MPEQDFVSSDADHDSGNKSDTDSDSSSEVSDMEATRLLSFPGEAYNSYNDKSNEWFNFGRAEKNILLKGICGHCTADPLACPISGHNSFD